MILSLQIAAVTLYLILAFQDIKDKAFSVILIPLLCITNFYLAYLSVNTVSFFETLKINSLFTGLLIISLYLYMTYKEGSFNLQSPGIGLGDFLILVTIIPLFVPALFKIVFFSVAVTGVLLSVIYLLIKAKRDIKIPLAGFLSVVCAALILLDILEIMDLYNEYLL